MNKVDTSYVFQSLTPDDLMAIDGGAISRKSLLIGIALTYLSPTLGVGYWFGYFVNN
ncbi:MAG: hypothetical protein ABFD09_12860 [Proteiniphilum sp.]